MNNQYKIRKVDDLFKIPADRRRACFDEVADALERIEELTPKLKAKIPAWLRWLAKPRLKEFVWIDDGERNETIRMGENILWQKP